MRMGNKGSFKSLNKKSSYKIYKILNKLNFKIYKRKNIYYFKTT